MKKILITGGAGFIGSEFLRVITKNEKFEVIVIDCLTYAGDLKRLEEIKEKIKLYKVSILNKEEIEKIFSNEKPNYIIHFAAETHVDRSITDATLFIETNVKGTQILLDTAKKYNCERFINITTDEVYGDLDEIGKFSEETSLNPSSPYSVSKASADMLGRSYFRTFNLPVITIRPSNNYGPWQYPEKLIPVVITKALQNQKIPVYGKGLNVREWLYVEDCVKGILEILKKGKIGEIYNIGSNEEKQNIDVVKSILKILNKSEELIEFVKDRPGHDFRYSVNIKKIQTQTNWKPQIKFEEGIEKTVKWYLNNLDWLEKNS